MTADSMKDDALASLRPVDDPVPIYGPPTNLDKKLASMPLIRWERWERVKAWWQERKAA